MRLLLLEDDGDLAVELVRHLKRAGFAVDHAVTLSEADVHLAVTQYDCLVLDRTVPDGDSLERLLRWRAQDMSTPTLMLTARGTIEDRVEGFEHGADDYVVKPFAVSELIARIRAVARRGATVRPSTLVLGDLVIDAARHTVTRGGVQLVLTAKEFAVLDVLARRPDEVVTRTQLVESCWDEMSDPMSNVVDVLIGQLRRRLGAPELIRTVRGVGYSLHPNIR